MIFATHPERPGYDLPLPVVSVGDKVKPFKVEGYARRRIVRALIASSLKTLKSLRRKGFSLPAPGDSAKLTKHTKSQIRKVLNVIDTAYEVEVVGISAAGGMLYGRTANQCYLNDVNHYCQLLWRSKVGENHVATVQLAESVHYAFSDHKLKSHIMKVETSN